MISCLQLLTLTSQELAFKYYVDNSHTEVILTSNSLLNKNTIHPKLREYITSMPIWSAGVMYSEIKDLTSTLLIKLLKSPFPGPIHYIQNPCTLVDGTILVIVPARGPFGANHTRCQVAYICLRWMRKTMSANEVLRKLQNYEVRHSSSNGLLFFCYYMGLDVIRLNYQVAFRQLLGLSNK